MKTGAVVVAAGMSSRMGEFKPMLKIGSASIAQHVIKTLRKAEVEEIVIVTGFQAEMLERHLADSGAVFLRNKQYETTQMFDSVRIGLSYLKDKCDRVLFTPVDIPLFKTSTVQAMLACDDMLVCPQYSGRAGHPICMDAGLVKEILEDCGEGGLRGAIQRLGIPMTRIEVEDSGILHDADTPSDYRKLLRMAGEGC